MAGSSSPLLSSSGSCQVQGCGSNVTYKASCDHKLCDRHVTNITAGSEGRLICPVDQELIQDNFRLLSDLSKPHSLNFIQNKISSDKAARRCCALGVCFILVFGLGFTYFQLR